MANFGLGLSLGLSIGTPLQYPLINGYAYSWASIEFKFDGSPIITVQSIDYKVTRNRKQPYGTNVNPLAKTRGQIVNEGKCKMLLQEGDNLLGALSLQDITGVGAYGDVFFDVDITYAEGTNIIADTLIGCTIDEVSESPSEGVDAIMVEFNLAPMQILRNGRPMSSQLLTAPQFP